MMDVLGTELDMEFLAGDLPGLEATLRAQTVGELLRIKNPQGTPRLDIMRVDMDEFIIEAAFGVNPHVHNQRAICTAPDASDLPMGQAFAAMGGNSYYRGGGR
ncbi:hypothetical protein COT83_03790 [Candidatus Peregrinibacteria bacterium CG10_big_fil_rev_8_21_14_0_10_44_7]|nr:MAG: hypothetical protein AUK45_04220 [Candidatus Peregrinibacteria bacterium CG2_30_44_17]PIS03855.1 MAG: hypothetical protein COT83_03790 [Candidatus Peregrinibacteria bacterium CG10_big_fil_rev_8_21_14_0_10_44_7]